MTQIPLKTLLITSPILITFLLSISTDATRIVITNNNPYYDPYSSMTISIDLGSPNAHTNRPNGLSYGGPQPNTLAKYYYAQQQQHNNIHFFDGSLVDQVFNVRAQGGNYVQLPRGGPVAGPDPGQWLARCRVHRVQGGRVVMQLREVM